MSQRTIMNVNKTAVFFLFTFVNQCFAGSVSNETTISETITFNAPLAPISVNTSWEPSQVAGEKNSNVEVGTFTVTLAKPGQVAFRLTPSKCYASTNARLCEIHAENNPENTASAYVETDSAAIWDQVDGASWGVSTDSKSIHTGKIVLLAGKIPEDSYVVSYDIALFVP